jgi:hypothetical protein
MEHPNRAVRTVFAIVPSFAGLQSAGIPHYPSKHATHGSDAERYSFHFDLFAGFDVHLSSLSLFQGLLDFGVKQAFSLVFTCVHPCRTFSYPVFGVFQGFFVYPPVFRAFCTHLAEGL